jgi:alkylated DNA repair dioxygenase AlkB
VRIDFSAGELPAGFSYRADFISVDDEQPLLETIRRLPFETVQMHGVAAKRRTVHYGYNYAYNTRKTDPGEPIPPFLLDVRARAAAWIDVEPDALAEALVTEYREGAPIGWHRDAPMFDEIVGISLGSPCRMKFRPYVSPKDVVAGGPTRRTTHEVELAPRSAYSLRGVVRREFEHSIPPVSQTRYSITFRTLRGHR